MANLHMERADIGFLLRQERNYRDCKQWEKLRACYHADDTKTFVNISWYKGGIDGFVQGSRKLSRDDICIIHDITPVSIQFGTGNKALAESTGRIYAQFVHDGVDLVMTSWVRFFTQLEKTGHGDNQEWKMLSLEVIYMFETIVPSFPPSPESPLSLDLSMVEGARRSYKCIAWHVAQNGVKVRDDLPGSDDPESVREVETRNGAWLSAI